MTEEERQQHAKFSPSASSRWLACSGSIVLAPEGDGEQERSVYAHEGTVCHDIAARCLKNKYTPDAHLGKIVDNVNITQELVDGIQMYIDEVRGIVKEIGAKGGKVEFEVDIAEDCWGTLDFSTWNEEMAVFVDLKMGKGVIVDAEENSQLMLYAIGGLKYLQKELGLSPSKIRLCIIQPRTVNPVRMWETTRAELIRWFQDVVQPAMAKIKAGDTSCTPGTTQCRWCVLSATCPEQSNQMIADAEGAFADFSPAVESGILTLQDIAELLPRFEHIENWIKAVKEYAMLEALAGNKIPGYKLVEGRSSRKWGADEKQVVEFLKTKAGIEPYVEKLITAPQAEKNIGKKKAEAIGLDKYIVKPPGNPTLVPESDTRPEMGGAVEEEFKEFVEDVPFEQKAEILTFDDVVLVDKEDEPQLSAWERLQRGLDEEEEDVTISKPAPVDRDSTGDLDSGVDTPLVQEVMEPPEVMKDLAELPKQTATGGNVVTKMVGIIDAVSPKKGTKRLDVLNMGGGGVTLKQAAEALDCTENMVKMHLRYLNETNGWNVIIYDTGEFIVN